MKKNLLFVLMMLCALTAGARTTTFNFRVGGGLISGYDFPRYESDVVPVPETGVKGGVTFMFQPNILFGANKQWVFAPTLQYELGNLGSNHSGMFHNIFLPILVGYRVTLGNSCIFVPKIGPVIGYTLRDDEHFDSDYATRDWPSYTYPQNYSFITERYHVSDGEMKNSFNAGLYLDLCFEIKKFIVALNGYYGFTSTDITWTEHHEVIKTTATYKRERYSSGSYVYQDDKLVDTTTDFKKSYTPYSLFVTFGYKF